MDLTLQKLREMFAAAASDISANEQYLCSLDSVCGDGDHGVAIRGAICAASDALKSASNLKDALYDAGMAAMANSNGKFPGMCRIKCLLSSFASWRKQKL